MSLCFYLSCPVLYFPIVYTTDRTLLGFNLPITTTTRSYIPLPNRDVTLSVPPPKVRDSKLNTDSFMFSNPLITPVYF